MKPKDAPERCTVVGGLCVLVRFLHSHFGDSPLSMYQVSFDSLSYLKRYDMDKLIIAIIKMGSNSVITCNRVTVLVLCTISNSHLSMYPVSFESLLYFQEIHTEQI